MTTDTVSFTKEQIDLVYTSRKNRLTHPEGNFDKQGRWYPSENENSDNYTQRLRSPSKAYPYSYLLGARTRKHIKALSECNPSYFQTLLDSI